MKEDNVYEDTTRAAETNTQGDGADRNNTETEGELPSKFKSVSALARAYEALQAEFTRRSQRLKELERQKENFAEAKKHNGAEAEKSCEVESLEEGTKGGVEVLGKTETAQAQETNTAKPEDADQANQDDGTGDATIIFPTDNVEAEKNKRNIH